MRMISSLNEIYQYSVREIVIHNLERTQARSSWKAIWSTVNQRFSATCLMTKFLLPCSFCRAASMCWLCWTNMQQGLPFYLVSWLRLLEYHGFMVSNFCCCHWGKIPFNNYINHWTTVLFLFFFKFQQSKCLTGKLVFFQPVRCYYHL